MKNKPQPQKRKASNLAIYIALLALGMMIASLAIDVASKITYIPTPAPTPSKEVTIDWVNALVEGHEYHGFPPSLAHSSTCTKCRERPIVTTTNTITNSWIFVHPLWITNVNAN